MIEMLVPAIWLLVVIVGLPQLSETVYTPSLPDIARDLHASESMVEYTLTIYLFAFAIGTLFWGKVSDAVGRKPCVLVGLGIFILGCIGCYFSTDISLLMVSRFVQAFGGSVGSVLGQAICRDAFHGPALGKVYSSTDSALALFPALGPVVGGCIAQMFGWSSIFIFLSLFAAGVLLLVAYLLPETHRLEMRKPVVLQEVAISLLTNKKVVGFGLIVAGCNGIGFSYFAEGSFSLIDILGLTKTQYGLSFVAIAASTMLGGILSKRLHSSHSSLAIMRYGIRIMVFATAFSSAVFLYHTFTSFLDTHSLIGVIILAQMITMFGVCMTTSNALALALVDYKACIGTASSLFGFFYYAVISLLTFGMGMLHTGTLLPMPLYFLTISMGMLVVQKVMLHD